VKRSVTGRPPRGPTLFLLGAWVLGSVTVAVSAARTIGGLPGGPAGLVAVAAIVLYALAECVALYYLIGFVLKSLSYLATAGEVRHTSRRATLPPATSPDAAGVAVLYLTAGDFDATALGSLLELAAAGPRLLVVHDDGDDSAARREIAEFVERHRRRAAWEVRVLHRDRRFGGKAGAVNWVLDQLEPRWQLLLLCDSDSIALDLDAVDAVRTEFDDPRVSVVQFRNRAFVDAEEPLFARRLARAIDVFDAFATPQAAWGYLPFFGHNALVRIASLRAIGGLTPGFFSDDLDFSARLTLAGQRILYRGDVCFAERHPADWLAFRKRARKWALGCMQVIRARARSVITTRDIPLAHRVGLLEFMGFYPAQALLVLGLAARHLVLPWIVATPAGPVDVIVGVVVVAALLLPTFAWALRERRLAEWPSLAWSCVLVYGGSILATVGGVRDGLSRRDRPWVPTNLAHARAAVPVAAWMECALGFALVLVPWWRRDGILVSSASYLFIAPLLLAPLTALAYRAGHGAAGHTPDRSRALGLSTAVFVAALVLAVVNPLPAYADGTPRLTATGSSLRLDGRPFRIRGVHYSPWLPGTGPGGAAPYPGPRVVDPDLDRIRSLGANAVLLDEAPAWVARHALERGMVTIYAFHLAWNDTSDSAFARQSSSLVTAVDSLRGAPGIVAWVLGNEIPDWVVADLGAARVEGRLRGLADRVRARDPSRLLGHGNWPPTRQLDLSFFDLACFNLYPAWPYEVAVRGYGPYLRDELLPAARGRPLLITEFGINSLEAGESRQATVLADCWREIDSSPTAGGVAFEWCDEWWKNYDNPIAKGDYWKRAYDPTDAARHDADPEEYYGIVRADRSAKPAYAAVARMWHGEPPARAWWPWDIAGAIVLLTAIALFARRGAPRAHAGSAGSTRVAIVLGAVLLLAPARGARAATWSTVDTLRSPTSADGQYGWTVANAFDLDGDGRDELAVGAHFATVGGLAGAGEVDIERGGWAPGEPWARLEGGQADEHFGEGIAGGGDLDGDGRFDLAVGAPMRSSGGFSANGGVDIFRGGAVLETTPWMRLAGEASDDWFGQSLAVGDFDGDGHADLAVGAPYNDRGGSAAGAVFIFRGGPAFSTAPWRVLVGEAANDQFGWSISTARDVSGDGVADLVIGARLHGLGLRAAAGRVYLFDGGPDMATVASAVWDGESRDDWFGNSVAGVGDVDGGGRPDFVVGAPYNDRAGSAAGAAYLFRGEDPPGSAPLAVFTGESTNAQFGWAVGGAGDVDGDGRPDLVVGARQQADGTNLAAGRIYLFAGSAHPSPTPAAIATGEEADDWLGNAVGGGFGALSAAWGAVLAGAPYFEQSASAIGRAYVLGMGPLVGVRSGPPLLARTSVEPNPARGIVRFRLASGTVSPQDATRELLIMDVRGRRIRNVPLALAADGSAVATWDLRDVTGRPVAPGVYLGHVLGSPEDENTLRCVVAR
jgi:hypothetical protein